MQEDLYAIGEIIISPDIFSEVFCCDIQKCKGICCVEGDSGAPLDEVESAIILRDYPKFKAYMQEAGRKAVAEQSCAVIDRDGDWVTPLIDGKECAYANFDENGVCYCAIERAFLEGKTRFRKPDSCWLYPIRVKKLANGALALNYDSWHSCASACIKGKKENIPVYRFLEEPLRKIFGDAFYQALEKAAQ